MVNMDIDKTNKIGAKNTTGQLKKAVNKIKRKMSLEKTKIGKMLKEAGADFSTPDKAMEELNLFKIWVNSKSVNELNEIERMGDIINILQTDMAQRTMEKIMAGVSLEEDDIKLIRLLKDCLETKHNMVHGVKHVNINADLNDIRRMMFQDENYFEKRKK